MGISSLLSKNARDIISIKKYKDWRGYEKIFKVEHRKRQKLLTIDTIMSMITLRIAWA